VFAGQKKGRCTQNPFSDLRDSGVAACPCTRAFVKGPANGAPNVKTGYNLLN
jgi:hypothetical protein